MSEENSRWLDAIPYSLIALFLRVVAAHPFFVSGQTKIEGPTIGREIFGLDLTVQIPTAISSATFALFADEYKLPFISPTVAAYAATAPRIRAAAAASPRAFDALVGVRSFGDDDDHPDLRLSRRVVDGPRLLGGHSHRAHRARTGSDLPRPSAFPSMIAAGDLSRHAVLVLIVGAGMALPSGARSESDSAPPPLRSATSQFVELRPLVEVSAPQVRTRRWQGSRPERPSGEGRADELLGDMVPSMSQGIAYTRTAH